MADKAVTLDSAHVPLVVAALEARITVVRRAIFKEFSHAVRDIRQAEIDNIQAIISSLRTATVK